MRTFVKVWTGIALLAIGFGIALVVLAGAFGDTHEDIPTYSLKESYNNVQKIDMNINYGEVKIVDGDSFSIDAENLGDKMETYVSNGTWYIDQESDRRIKFFGIDISQGNIGRWNDDLTPKITITIPKDFIADNVTLKVGAGSVDVNSVKALEGDFAVGAGRLSIDEMSVSKNTKFDVGAGELVIKDAELNDVAMKCGVGNVTLEGTVTGDNDINCGIGKIYFALSNKENEYSYDIITGIGNVVINGKSYHSINRSIDNKSDNFLRLDCGIGNITVDFK